MTRVTTCDACGVHYESSHDSLPDDGWDMPYDLFGYYGGFTDNIGVLLGGDRSRSWWLCHSCVVKFLETFPRLAESIGASCHPTPQGAEPCCRHAWRGTEIFGKYKNGKPVPGVQTQTAWPDGVWHDDEIEN